MDSFEKLAHARESFRAFKPSRTFVKLAQVGSGRKSMLSRAGNYADRRFRRQRIERGDKLLEVRKHRGANLIGGLAVERQLQNAVIPIPSQRFPGKRFHADFPLYMVAISAE
jgi:hypothetical protein